MFPVGPYTIERLAHIGAVARGDKALQVEGHFLAAHAQLDGAVVGWHGHGGKQLLDVEFVLVRRRQRVLLESARVDQLAAASVAEQKRIEASDQVPFEDYRREYTSPERLGTGARAVLAGAESV